MGKQAYSHYREDVAAPISCIFGTPIVTMVLHYYYSYKNPGFLLCKEHTGNSVLVQLLRKIYCDREVIIDVMQILPIELKRHKKGKTQWRLLDQLQLQEETMTATLESVSKCHLI